MESVRVPDATREGRLGQWILFILLMFLGSRLQKHIVRTINTMVSALTLCRRGIGAKTCGEQRGRDSCRSMTYDTTQQTMDNPALAAHHAESFSSIQPGLSGPSPNVLVSVQAVPQ